MYTFRDHVTEIWLIPYVNLRIDENVVNVQLHCGDLLSGVNHRVGCKCWRQSDVFLDVIYLSGSCGTFSTGAVGELKLSC